MKDYIIVADANCDLEEEYQEKYGIRVLPGHAVLPDKTEILTWPKWDAYTQKDFYSELKKNPDGFATSPTNAAEFEIAFVEAAKEGKDVLCMTISAAISGAYNFARQAASRVESSYPEVSVKVIDTRRFGPGFGLMTIYAAEQRNSGKSLDETIAWIEGNKNRFHQAGWLDDLAFVAKKGRMTNAKAFFGTLAGIKPLGEFDKNGLTSVIGKIKGGKKALAVLISYIRETIEHPEDQIIFIAHGDRLAQAEIYKQMIEETFRPKAVIIKDMHISCGINVGPGLMAAYYVGTEITEDLANEMKIIEKYNSGAEL